MANAFLRVFKSSHPEVFCKKVAFKNFAKFTGNQLCQSPVLMVCNFIKKANQTQVCSCELWEFFKNTFVTDHLWVTASLSSSVIRQKGESQNGCYKKTKHAKFSETNISYSLIHTRACTYQGVRKVRLSENLRAFFLVTPVLRFTLLAYYR